jgi:hypothetical protein
MNGKDFLDFIKTYRRGYAFLGWTDYDILSAYTNMIEHNSGAVSIKDGEIHGVVIGYPFESEKCFRVEQILVKPGKKGVIAGFLSLLNKLYPGYSLEYQRKKKGTKFFTQTSERFFNKLTKI